MREKTLERRLANKAKAAGGYCIKLVPLHLAGLPDRLLLLPGGRAVFVELKSAGEKAGPLQKVWARRLKKIGFEHVLADSAEGIDDIFNAQ